MYMLKAILIFSFIQLGPTFIYAQMFSVDVKEEKKGSNRTVLTLGTIFTDFSYRGNSQEEDQKKLEIKDPALWLNIETRGVLINLLLKNSLTGYDEGSFIDLNLSLNNKIRIINKRNFTLSAPLRITSGATSSNRENTNISFNQTYIGIGGGLYIEINPKNNIKITSQGVIGYGFSNSNGGRLGGTTNHATINTNIEFQELMWKKNFRISYKYIFRSYDVDNNQMGDDIYDYNLKGHNI